MHEISHNVVPGVFFTNPIYSAVDAILNTEIAQWYYFLKESLPKGFQAMIKIRAKNTIEYEKGIKIGESGSFAKVKMETLERFQHFSLTGDHSIDVLIKMIQAVEPNYDISGFSHLENPCQLTRKQHEELRNLGITAYLGGIRVPMRRFVSMPSRNVIEELGEILISFSALTGEQDLMMCFIILTELQKALQKSNPDTTYIFNLAELKKSPVARFNMNMRILEATTSK